MRILVVDDDEAFRYLICRMLKQNAAEPLAAENVLRGLDLMDAHPEIERAVIDVRMPPSQPNGLTLAFMARQRRPRFRSVLTSAHCEYLGMDEFSPFGGVLPKSDDLRTYARQIFERLEGISPA